MQNRPNRNDPCPCGSGKKYKRCCLGKEPPKPLPTQARPSSLEPPSRSPAAPARASERATPKPPPPPPTEWDDWCDRFAASSFAGKIDMLRDCLAEDHSLTFYTDTDFVGTILQMSEPPDDEDRGAYIAFLEEMFTSHPEVFKLGADWFVRDMAYAYVRGGRDHEIARLLPPLLGDDYKPNEPVFDLGNLLRLAGMNEESRRLTFALLEKTGHGGYMGWAIRELIEFAVFFLQGDALDAACTPEALSELRKQLAQLHCDPSEESLNAMLAHRGGTAARKFTMEDLLGHEQPAGFNLYLLSLDFGRWLAQERRMPPLVADTMRCFVLWCLGEMCEKADRNPLTIRRQRLEKYLARLLGPLSLSSLRAVATLIGMRHFSDFLLSLSLIDEKEHHRTTQICDDFWSQVQWGLGDAATNYAVLDKYA